MLQWLGFPPACSTVCTFSRKLRTVEFIRGQNDKFPYSPSDPLGLVRSGHERSICPSHETQSEVGMGAFVVCFFHPGRGRGPHRDRIADCPGALVHVHGGFERNFSENGIFRRQLGSFSCVFWVSVGAIRGGYYFRCLSRDLSCGWRSNPAGSSAP